MTPEETLIERARQSRCPCAETDCRQTDALLTALDRANAEIEKLTFKYDEVRKMADDRVEKLTAEIAMLREAIQHTIARADDYADSYLSQPVRQALAKLDQGENGKHYEKK